MREQIINWLIKVLKANTNKISDGYHTFGELYKHRIALWIYVCKRNKDRAWKSQRHSDGSILNGWFLLGMNTKAGRQITYHLPISYWKELYTINTKDRAPKWDGHTSETVLIRINGLGR